MLDPKHFIPLGTWKPYGEKEQTEREAKMLAGRLLVFYKGVAVKQYNNTPLCHVWVWGEPQQETANI